MPALLKYNAKYHDPWGFSLACDGRTDIEIAEAMGVTERTINNWKFVWESKEVPVLDKEGKPVLDKDGKQTFRIKKFVVIDENGEKKLSSFGEELLKGKNVADANVEQSLYKSANGFTYEEKEEIVEVGSDGRPKPLKIRKTTRYIKPDVMAQMYWLNNRSRRTGKWGQKQDVNLTVGNFEALNDAFEALKDDAD